MSAHPDPGPRDEHPARPGRRRGGSRVRAPRVVSDVEAENLGAPDHPDLELDDDPEFQRRIWDFQRVGWVGMALILAAALLGLVGRGPLSDAHTIHPDASLAVEYQRFGRHGCASQIRVHLLPGAARDGAARLRLDRGFVENVENLQILPEPTRVETGSDWVVFQVATTDAEGPGIVVLDYTPASFGPLRCRLGLDHGAPLPIQQFIYP